MNKKIISCLIIGFILCSSLNAQTTQEGNKGTASDSTFVFHYPPCIQMFKADYKSNRQTIIKETVANVFQRKGYALCEWLFRGM